MRDTQAEGASQTLPHNLDQCSPDRVRGRGCVVEVCWERPRDASENLFPKSRETTTERDAHHCDPRDVGPRERRRVAKHRVRRGRNRTAAESADALPATAAGVASRPGDPTVCE